MTDDADTIVDPQIRREALAPRPDHRRLVRTVLLVAVTAALTAFGTLYYALRPAPASPAPRPPPPAVVVPPAAIEPPAALPPAAPPSPEIPPAAPPSAERPRGEPSYRQKHHDGEAPTRRDRAPD